MYWKQIQHNLALKLKEPGHLHILHAYAGQ